MSILDKVIAAVTPSDSEAQANAIDLLNADHEEVDRLFKDYELLADGDGDAGDRRALSTQICGLLAVHAMIEGGNLLPSLHGGPTLTRICSTKRRSSTGPPRS
jgi:hypothetical protein